MILAILPTSIDEIWSWLVNAIGFSLIISIAILFGSFFVFNWLAKKYITQAMLIIPVWLPSVLISFLTDLSQAPNAIIPPKGITLILFPYVWDLLFGMPELRAIGAIMIGLSFVCFLHFGLMFTHNRNINKLWSLLIAYFMLLGLGVGLINFHWFLVMSVASSCANAGVPPVVIPLVISVFIMTLLFYKYGYKKKLLKK